MHLEDLLLYMVDVRIIIFLRGLVIFVLKTCHSCVLDLPVDHRQKRLSSTEVVIEEQNKHTRNFQTEQLSQLSTHRVQYLIAEYGECSGK